MVSQKKLFVWLWSLSLWSQTICLNMIVKNEAQVVERCLASVKDHIDYWVIVDTGSSDGTQEIIRNFLKEIPGELHERLWKNFEHNRNEALALARGKGDYLLFLDADERLEFGQFPKLTDDCYVAVVKCSHIQSERILLAKSSLAWRWEGVLHEALTCPGAYTVGKLTGVTNISEMDGARSRDPEKYLKDALVLEEALKKEPKNSRYLFFLGQSYMEAGKDQKAYEAFQKRIGLGGAEDEVFWSTYISGFLKEKMGQSPVEMYKRASEMRPHRAEPLYRLAMYYGNHQMMPFAYQIAKKGVSLSRPSEDRFMVEHWIYDWGMEALYAECLMGMKKYKEAAALFQKVLEKEGVFDEVRNSCEKKLGICRLR